MKVLFAVLMCGVLVVAMAVAVNADQLSTTYLVDEGVDLKQETPPEFIRGDAEADGDHDIFDGLKIIYWLGGTTGNPPCINAADTEDDEDVDIFDGLRIIYWLGGTAGPPPKPCCVWTDSCGPDPTAGALSCSTYTHCPW